MNRQLSLQTVIFIFLFSFISGQIRYQNEIFDEVLKTENVVYGNAPDLPSHRLPYDRFPFVS